MTEGVRYVYPRVGEWVSYPVLSSRSVTITVNIKQTTRDDLYAYQLPGEHTEK